MPRVSKMPTRQKETHKGAREGGVLLVARESVDAASKGPWLLLSPRGVDPLDKVLPPKSAKDVRDR
jgi:hypothetical protein